VKFSPGLFREPRADAPEGEGLLAALRRGGIISGIPGSDKSEVLREVVSRIPLPDGFDRSVLLQLFLAREAAGTTAVGDGIAIPHPRHPVVLALAQASLSLCFLDQPVDFGAADHQPVQTLFVLISPTIRTHLRMLARVACALRDESLRTAVKRRGTQEEIVRAIERVEESFGREVSSSQGPE
jgi:nitrogen PTS system EIIA component